MGEEQRMKIPKLIIDRDEEQKTLDQIEHLIKTRRGETPSHIFTFTSWVSEQLVERYNAGELPGKDGKWHNRSHKPAKITEFSHDMTDEQWKLTGDTIKFSDKQRLRDGQNRLFACMRSGKPFRTHVVFGIDDNVFPWMDRGKPRSGADALYILDIENANAIAGIVRWLELLRTGRVKERDSFTPAQIVELFKNYDREKLKTAIILARKVYSADRTPITLGAALAYSFGERAEGLRDRFFEAWATGNWASPMTPLRLCSSQLGELRQYSHGRVNDVVRAAMWIVAWNAVVTRKKRASKDDFKWRTSEQFPEIRG
jgi:hypothetical protein